MGIHLIHPHDAKMQAFIYPPSDLYDNFKKALVTLEMQNSLSPVENYQKLYDEGYLLLNIVGDICATDRLVKESNNFYRKIETIVMFLDELIDTPGQNYKEVEGVGEGFLKLLRLIAIFETY